MARNQQPKKEKPIEDLEREKPRYPNQVLKFSLPIPPSVNHIYQNVGRGARRLTTNAMQYIKTAQDIVKKEVKRSKWKMDDRAVWQFMDLYFYFPDKRRRDSHNCLKLLTDSMEGLLFHDDYFLLPRIQDVQLDRENPRLDIIFYPKDYEVKKK